MFGLTLMCLRSRLRPQSMVDFAELWMHLWDEHLCCGSLKESLKQKIMSHSECKEPPEHPTPVSPLPFTSQEIQQDVFQGGMDMRMTMMTITITMITMMARRKRRMMMTMRWRETMKKTI